MHHYLAGSQVKLTYLQDRRALAAIDWPLIFDDLGDVNHWQWCDLDSLTHVVLAVDRVSSRYVGMLGLTARAAQPERWLLVALAFARAQAFGGMLGRAMLAHALARVICVDGKPAAIVAPFAHRDTLGSVSRQLRSVALYPPMDGNLLAFQAAKFARKIGPERTVLDLRGVPEASLLRDLRMLHRAGPVADADATTSQARSAAATRRPRKATRTGRTV